VNFWPEEAHHRDIAIAVRQSDQYGQDADGCECGAGPPSSRQVFGSLAIRIQAVLHKMSLSN
jgi:hypothetical protein